MEHQLHAKPPIHLNLHPKQLLATAALLMETAIKGNVQMEYAKVIRKLETLVVFQWIVLLERIVQQELKKFVLLSYNQEVYVQLLHRLQPMSVAITLSACYNRERQIQLASLIYQLQTEYKSRTQGILKYVNQDMQDQ